jgi:hypothetical protein
MLGIDEGGGAARLLHFSDEVQRNGRFPRGLGAKDFRHAPPWNPAHPQGGIEGDRAGRNDRNIPGAGLGA